MATRALSGQAGLGLELTDPPVSAMREAYERCRLTVSFERALDLPQLRIGLRNVALGLMRAERRRGRQ